VELRRQLAIVRAWFPFLVACVLLAGGAAYLFSNTLPKVYEANATLIVGQSLSTASPDYNQLLVSQRLSTTYASLATKRPNLEAVITKLGLDQTTDQLARSIRAVASLDSTILTITAQDADPAKAAAIANALADQLIAASSAIQGREAAFQASVDADLKATQDQIRTVQTQVEALTVKPVRTAKDEADLQTLEGRLVSLRSTFATLLAFSSGNASNLLSVIESAVAPPTPVSPRPLLNALLAAMLGLFVGGIVLVIKEHLDDTIKTPEDVVVSAGLPTLGVITRMAGGRSQAEMYRLAALLYPRSAATEAYRTLRANIEFASPDDEAIKTLLVTSSVPGEGKTVTAGNLAVVFAQAGQRVLLVDADLRKPGVHRLFDVPNGQGLSTLLRGEKVDLSSIAQATEQDNLHILTTGPIPPNPVELLGSRRMKSVVERLKASYDLVIFDSAPLLVVTDSAILSTLVDGTVFVIGAGGGRRTIRLGRESLDRAGANVLGAVLNRLRDPARAGQPGTYGVYGATGEEDGRPSGVRTHA
jgi:non-specific protein-tyrosine kinase